MNFVFYEPFCYFEFQRIQKSIFLISQKFSNLRQLSKEPKIAFLFHKLRVL